MKSGFLVLLLACGALAACHHVQEDMSDSAIKARVMRSLQTDPGIDLSRISVDVTMANVTVSGIIASDEQRDRIRRLARHADGVDEVSLNLFVQP